MKKITPIAVCTYNRPDHTRCMLDSLAACVRSDECQVFIFSDGPRLPEHAPAVQNVREIIRNWGRIHRAKIVEQTDNKGLAHSIVDGVTQLCNEFGRVIVLEDDLILHPTFLDFMLQALDRYSEEDRVAQIAGFTFPIEITDLATDSFFLPLVTSWGWATWKRAWDLFSWDLHSALAELNADSCLLSRFNLDGAYPYYELLRDTANDKVDTWDIQWYWSTFRQGKITLYPHHSLVWQNGFDEIATHTKGARAGIQAPLDKLLKVKWDNPSSFPDKVQTDEIAFDKLKSFLRRESVRSPLIRLSGILKRKLLQFINKRVE